MLVWLKGNWKRVALVALAFFVVASIVRAIIPTGGGPSKPAAKPKASPTPSPITVRLGDVTVPVGGQPVILLNPGLARPNTTVQVSGSGFDAGGRIDVVLKPTASPTTKPEGVASGTVTKDGGLSASFSVPSSCAQGCVVTASQRNSTKKATADLALAEGVGSVTLATNVGAPGARVPMSAAGFQSGERLDVFWGKPSGIPTDTLTADTGGGVAKASIAVGAVAVGDASVFVVGAKSGVVASAPFQVLSLYPTVTVAPYALKAGERLGIVGKGFVPNEQVDLLLNSGAGPPVAKLAADQGGGVGNAGFVVPFGLKGGQQIVLIGEQSRAAASSGFTVLDYQPSCQASTYGGLPGTVLSFYCKDFAPSEAVHVFVGRTHDSPGTVVTAFRADPKGATAAGGAYTVPSSAGDTVTFTLVGAQSGGVATVSFKVDKSIQVSVPDPPAYQLPKELEK